MSEPSQVPKPSSYAVLLSGSHVTGKETLADSLAKSLSCPWLKAEMVQNSATSGARSQAKKGFNHSEVFGRIWFSKMRRIGFLSDGNESDGEGEVDAPRRRSTASWNSNTDCAAVITCYAMRQPAREAIRNVLLIHSIRPMFVILQITEETLSERTLGAEEPELAERIMGEKMADIQELWVEEKDVILIDSMRNVDSLFLEIRNGISRQLADM